MVTATISTGSAACCPSFALELGVKAGTDPSGPPSNRSTATTPGRLVATSAQSPPLPPLRVLLRPTVLVVAAPVLRVVVVEACRVPRVRAGPPEDPCTEPTVRSRVGHVSRFIDYLEGRYDLSTDYPKRIAG